MIKKMIWLCLFLCLGCDMNKGEVNVHVTYTADKQSVQITGLDNAVIQDIARDSAGGNWQALVPVYKMPADTDLKNYQPVQPGTYRVKDNAVIFVPDTPFKAHQTYFIRYYKFDAGNKVTNYIMGHNRPGSLHYSDLTFK